MKKVKVLLLAVVLVFVFTSVYAKTKSNTDTLKAWREVFEKACRSNSTTEVEKFIQEGADVNAEVEDLGSPLILCIRDCLWYPSCKIPIVVKIARLLIEKGADVNVKSRLGYTALHYAVNLLNKAQTSLDFKSVFELVKLLVEKGVEINAKSSSNTFGIWGGKTPFSFASMLEDGGEIPLVVLSRTSGMTLSGIIFNVSLSVIDKEAAKIVRYLLSKGADYSIRTDRGYTALFYAELIGLKRTARVLKAHGAKLSLKEKKDLAVIRLLGKHGPRRYSCSVQTINGQTKATCGPIILRFAEGSSQSFVIEGAFKVSLNQQIAFLANKQGVAVSPSLDLTPAFIKYLINSIPGEYWKTWTNIRRYEKKAVVVALTLVNAINDADIKNVNALIRLFLTEKLAK